MGLRYRPLGVVKDMLEQIGIEVTYTYEDLVFIKHNSFMLQFGTTGEMLFYYTNIETHETEEKQLFAAVHTLANAQGFTLVHRGSYRLSAEDGEELRLSFLNNND